MLVSNNIKSENDMYLDIRKLEEDRTYTKIAYVQDVKDSISSINEGFFKFYLKDINGDMVIARLFGVKDFMKIASRARMLKHKAVTIKFYTQIYNGSLSVILTDIDIYTDPIDYSKFIGKVDNLDVMVSRLAEIEDIELMKTSRLTEFCNGKVGGYALFAYLVTQQVKSYVLSNLTNYEVLERTVNDLLPLLFNYYRKLEVQPVSSPTDIIMDANTILLSHSFLGDTSILIDAYISCCGISKPQFLESILIYNIINNVLDVMRLSVIEKQMTPGSLKQLDGTVLKKL